MLSVHIRELGNQESEEAQGVWLITSGSWIGGRQRKESLAGYSTKQWTIVLSWSILRRASQWWTLRILDSGFFHQNPLRTSRDDPWDHQGGLETPSGAHSKGSKLSPWLSSVFQCCFRGLWRQQFATKYQVPYQF